METGREKSRLVAGILGIFVGFLGIHNFYLGYHTKAIVQISCSLGSLFLGLIFLISFFFFCFGVVLVLVPCGMAVWALVEAIMIFTGKISVDGRGIPLID